MGRISYITDMWNTVKELDLRPLRQQALNGIKIAIIGMSGSGRSTLADQIRRDPARPIMQADTMVQILDLDSADQAMRADLIILMVDTRKTDIAAEKQVAYNLARAGKKVLVFLNQFEEGESQLTRNLKSEWGRRRVLQGSVLDTQFLIKNFAPAVINLVPRHLLALGRYFPMFRVPVARYLINDACFSNAAYALSTGLGEIIAILDIPLAMTDMVILTKTQAYLVYKLGLALGFSTRWQDYWVEFGSVLGGGFMWRQLARTLIGLIPVYGIVPKVAVAYSGTYVVGNAVLQWYLTGRHLSKRQIQQFYRQAFTRGKNIASSLLSKMPRPRLSWRKRHKLPAPQEGQTCPTCGRASTADASFCQYCSQPFTPEIPPGDISELEMES